MLLLLRFFFTEDFTENLVVEGVNTISGPIVVLSLKYFKISLYEYLLNLEAPDSFSAFSHKQM